MPGHVPVADGAASPENVRSVRPDCRPRASHAGTLNAIVVRRLRGGRLPARMPEMSAALILTGAPGSGKSSVLDALGTLLEIDEMAFGALESEELARGWPWLSTADWLSQLAAVIALQRHAGRDLFLVAATTETQLELQGVIDALAVDRVLVICLTAPPDLVAERITRREPDAWPGKDPLVVHARELADSIPAISGIDAVLNTDGRAATDVAADVRDLLRDHDLLPTEPR